MNPLSVFVFLYGGRGPSLGYALSEIYRVDRLRQENNFWFLFYSGAPSPPIRISSAWLILNLFSPRMFIKCVFQKILIPLFYKSFRVSLFYSSLPTLKPLFNRVLGRLLIIFYLFYCFLGLEVNFFTLFNPPSFLNPSLKYLLKVQPLEFDLLSF